MKSYVEVGLDAPAEDANSRYEGAGGDRTFKMAGNPLERLLSTWSKYENYTLKTTDEFQKGGIRAETRRELEQLAAQGKFRAVPNDGQSQEDANRDAISTWAEETAKQRTFQNDSSVSRAMEKGRDALNSIHVGDIGAGDILLPFAKVPGNLAAQSANYSPLGFFNSIRQMASVMIDAKRGVIDPVAQAQAARNFGRGISGTALLAGFGALSVNGLIDVAGGDDEDKEALEKAQGKSGTQWNLSATVRAIDGGSKEWQDGDTIVSIGFLDPINSIMAAGSLLADEYKEEDGVTLQGTLEASLGGVWQAILDLPAMTSISDLINSYKYAEGDTDAAKLVNAALDYAGSQAASFLVPNALRGIATGFDDTVRNQYSGETLGEATVDSIKSGIPGLRETLPASIDPLGREKTQTGNTMLNVLNNNVLPGQISKYKLSDVEAEIESVYDATGNASVYPDKSAPNSIKYDSESYPLSSEQKQEYQRDLGSTYYDMVSGMMESDIYKNATPEQQAEYLGIAEEYAAAIAKKGVVGDNFEMDKKFVLSERADKELGISQEEYLMLYKQYGATLMNGDDIREAYASGMDVMDYLDYGTNKPKYNTDGKQGYTLAETAKAIQGSGLSEDEQTMLWLIEKPEWGEKAAKSGVKPSVYVDFKVATIGIESDKNSKGEVISGSKKKKILKVLDRMGVSPTVRNKILEAEGYSTK